MRLYIALIIVLLSILSGVVFYFYSTVSYSNVELFSAIPKSNALVVMRARNFANVEGPLAAKIGVEKELFNNMLLQKGKNLLSALSGLLVQIKDSTQRNSFKGRPFTLSGHLEHDSIIDFLFLASIKNRVEKGALVDAFGQNNEITKVGVFLHTDILQIRNVKNNILLFYCLKDGLLAVSETISLLELSIEQQISATNLLGDPTFLKLLKVSRNTDFDGLFLNLDRFRVYGKLKFPAQWQSPLACIDPSSRWAQYDIDYKDNKLSLNGILVGSESGLELTRLFGNKNGRLTLDKIYPASTSSLINYSFGNEDFKGDFRKFVSSVNSKRSEMGDMPQPEINAIGDFVDSEFGMGYFEATSLDSSKVLLLVKISNASNFTDALDAYQKHFNAQLESEEIYKVDAQSELKLFKGISGKAMNYLFGSFFSALPSRYMAVVGGYWVVSDQKDLIKRVFQDWILNNTLSNNTAFKQYRRNFADQENIFFYSNTTRSSFLAQVPDIKDINASQPAVFGSQLAVNDSFSYSTVVVDYDFKNPKYSNVSWKTHLDSVVVINPGRVINPATKERLLLVQDGINNLYLINPIGRILWKRALEGKIVGGFNQVGNAILFNTADKIFQIDFNGNNIGTFPVLLPSKSTAGLSLFDYEHNGDFRLFIPSVDKEIRVFDGKGNLVVGFQTQPTQGVITNPIQHFVVGDKDYILYSDGASNAILDRKGVERIAIGSPFQRNGSSSFYHLNERGSNYFVTSNRGGQIVKIAIPSGEVTFLAGIPSPIEHYFFLVELEKSRSAYLFVTKEAILMLSTEGKVLINKPLSLNSLSEVMLLKDSKKTPYLSFLDQGDNKIYLFNLSAGESLAGYPRYGEFGYLFDFDANDTISLFTGSYDSFLIHY